MTMWRWKNILWHAKIQISYFASFIIDTKHYDDAEKVEIGEKGLKNEQKRTINGFADF